MQPQLCPCLTLDLYFWWFNLCFENHNSGVHLWRLSIIQFWKPLTHNLRVRLQKYIFLTPLYVEPETNAASFCFLVRVFLSCTSAYWVTISYLSLFTAATVQNHILTYCLIHTHLPRTAHSQLNQQFNILLPADHSHWSIVSLHHRIVVTNEKPTWSQPLNFIFPSIL